MKNFILASLILFSLSSHATVSFDFTSGAGFVGRGDIIDSLGKEALDTQISFTYIEDAKYEVPCIRDNGVHRVPVTLIRKVSIDASVLSDTRTNRQGHITGFLLNGFANEIASEGNLSCPPGFENNGEPVLVALNEGGLYANDVLILDSIEQQQEEMQ